jgi:hypothetical protein
MFNPRKNKRLAAIAAAGLASAALAAPALASPIDSLWVIDGPSHTFQFGGSGTCSAGNAPSAGAKLNWHENLTAKTVSPQAIGDLCLQKTTGTYRVALEYYDNSHNLLGTYGSKDSTGNGAKLNTFSVSKQGPALLSSAMNHVHVVVQEKNGATYTDVGIPAIVDYP